MILRVCLCIPIYDNPLTIAGITGQILTETQLPIIIVDDGSKTPVLELFQSDQNKEAIRVALKSGRIEILRLSKNQGKGAALQYAIAHSVKKGFTHLFSFDGDGQHLVTEISKALSQAKSHPWDLIVGARKLQTANVPGVSKFGRTFSNFWVHFQTNHAVKDSQSGFRIYPLFFLQNMKFFCKSFDFEIEVLVRLMWKGVNVRDIDIEVYYPPKSERVSHFDKLWDNVRISILNTLLVIMTLLKSHRAPRASATALGLGVWIGCTPFFGLHTLIIAAFSFIFRLNAAILLLGSQISIPPLAPLIIYFSIKFGTYLRHLGGMSAPIESFPVNGTLHSWLEFGRSHFFSWLIGSLILGAALGSLIGLSFYVFTLRYHSEKPKNKPNWNGKSRGGKFGNAFLKFTLNRLGLNAGYFCLLFVVPYFYLFAPSARKSLQEYWSILMPQQTWLKRQINILRHFYRFGQILMDRVFQNFQVYPYFKSTPHGLENIKQGGKHSKGLILLGAHMGGWDLASSLLKYHGFSSDVHIVEFQAQEDSFQEIKGEDSAVASVNMSNTPQPIFQIHEILRRGKTLGIMGDRPLSNRIMLVLLLGKLAPIDVTPFRLAAATQASLIFTFGFKETDRRYDFYASPAKLYIYSTEYERECQLSIWAQEYADHLSEMIRKYPHQWFNFYSFWSTRPASPIFEEDKTREHYLLEELSIPLFLRPGLEFVL